MDGLSTTLFLLFLLILNYQRILCSNSLTTDKLELLTIVHRHGERTPYKFFANDPYSDPKYWPDGKIQLTSSGRRRMYALGKSIREKYSGFLVDNPRLVYARSSDADRCIESSELVLHGIFKATDRWAYSNETKYLPIPIHTVPTALDGMLTIDCDCPEANSEKLRLLHSDTAKSIMRDYADTLSVVKKETGNDLGDLSNISDFYNTIEIEMENIKGYQRPKWLTDKVLEELHIMSDAGMYIAQSSPKILRLRTSNFFTDLNKRFNAKLHGDTENGGDINFLSYSTHDNLLSAILIALGIFDSKAPPYGATLIIELFRSSNNKSYVKISYWNITEAEPNEIALLSCDNQLKCPIDRFTKSIYPYMLRDWQAECGLKHEPTLWSSGIFVSLVVILGLVIFIGLVWLTARQCYGLRNGYRSIA